MNDTLQTLLRSILKIGAGYLIQKGVVDQANAEILIGAILAATGVIWGIFHRRQPTPGTGIPVSIFFLALLPLLAAGCVNSAVLHGDIVEVTERTFGIDVSQSPQNQTPRFRIGLLSSRYVATPVSTNSLYAPATYSSFDIDQNITHNRTSEDYATGDGVRFISTNSPSPAKLGAARATPSAP